MHYAIQTTDLTKTYRGKIKGEAKQALNGVSLAIPQGSFFGLLGPNGAGKSTFINILAGLVNKTSGQVVINGIDQDQDPRATRFQLGVVPQEVVLDPFFPIREMLEHYAGFFAVPPSKRRTDEILAALHLTDKAHLNSRRLSGGMKRRVLIAKALVHNPPILILDEPTAGVDVELRQQLWEYVRELNRRGTTILLTTHYLEEAEELCDHIAIINHGSIIANDATPVILGKLDQKQVIFTLAAPLKKIPASLKPYHPELIDPHHLKLQFAKSAVSFDTLLGFTMREKLTITDIVTQEPDLEDIFRHLVRQPQVTTG